MSARRSVGCTHGGRGIPGCRRTRRRRALTLAVAGALLRGFDDARAQSLDGLRVGASGAPHAADARRPRPDIPADSAPSTLSQRFAIGLGVGVLSAALAGRLAGPEAGYTAYVAGSAAGVLLAGHAREGARPLPVLVGAAVGALPLLAAYEAEDIITAFSAGVLGAITTPLLGALAHQWGGPRRGTDGCGR